MNPKSMDRRIDRDCHPAVSPPQGMGLGIVINMTGAFASHVAVGNYGDYAYHLIATAAIALLTVASWALRPRDRVLGELLPATSSKGAHQFHLSTDPT